MANKQYLKEKVTVLVGKLLEERFRVRMGATMESTVVTCDDFNGPYNIRLRLKEINEYCLGLHEGEYYIDYIPISELIESINSRSDEAYFPFRDGKTRRYVTEAMLPLDWIPSEKEANNFLHSFLASRRLIDKYHRFLLWKFSKDEEWDLSGIYGQFGSNGFDKMRLSCKFIPHTFLDGKEFLDGGLELEHIYGEYTYAYAIWALEMAIDKLSKLNYGDTI